MIVTGGSTERIAWGDWGEAVMLGSGRSRPGRDFPAADLRPAIRRSASVDATVFLRRLVDVTVEPGLEELHRGETFGAYATAPSTDFGDYPGRPYYPSRSGLDRPAISADEARPMLMSNDSCRSYLLCALSIHLSYGACPDSVASQPGCFRRWRTGRSRPRA